MGTFDSFSFRVESGHRQEQLNAGAITVSMLTFGTDQTYYVINTANITYIGKPRQKQADDGWTVFIHFVGSDKVEVTFESEARALAVITYVQESGKS
jgi:hypothetical protein